MATIYDAAGGADGLLALARAWELRCLADPEASHPFSRPYGHPDHLVRLAAYWAEALGGPRAYSELGTEVEVLRLHAGNGEHRSLDLAAVACFDQALDDVGVTEPARTALHDYFAWSTDRMASYPDSPHDVPPGAVMPHWDWSGPVVA